MEGRRMSAPGGDWRDGSAYDYVDQLGIEKIAHEFLRRNDKYAFDYETLNDELADDQPPPALARWGLRFRGQPEHPRRSGSHGLASAGRSTPRPSNPSAVDLVCGIRSGRDRRHPHHVGR